MRAAHAPDTARRVSRLGLGVEVVLEIGLRSAVPRLAAMTAAATRTPAETPWGGRGGIDGKRWVMQLNSCVQYK